MEKSGRFIVIDSENSRLFFDWDELKQYRDLVFFLVLRDIRVLYKQTILGFGWAIIRPFLTKIVFSVVFGRLAKVPSDGVPYPIFSFAALVPWTYFASALTGSAQSLISQSNIFTKVYFPRIFIPITPIFSKLVDFLISFGVLACMMLYYGRDLTWNVLYLPTLVLLMILTTTGMGIWLSTLAIQYRDVKHAMEFVSQFLMYSAPVVWPASLIPEQYRLLYGLYPMVGIIEGFRSCLIGTRPMPWDLITMGSIGAIVLAVSGIAYFRRTERFFADIA